MKSTARAAIVLLLALAAGCTSSRGPAGPEEAIGMRKQKSLLAKARPLQEFGFSPSFPFGNRTLYIGSTLLEPDQTADMTFEPGGMPVIPLQGTSDRRSLSVLLDTASDASWMQYSCARKNGLVFLNINGGPIPHLGNAGVAGINAFAGVVPRLRIDTLSLNNTPFYIRMAEGIMQPVVYSSTPPQVDAVLGYDNLRQFSFMQIDLRKGTVRFSTSTPYAPDEERLMDKVSISTVCRDRLAVDGSVGGEPVPVVLDFAGDFSFARGDNREPETRQVDLGEIVFLNVPNEVLSSQDTYPRAGRRMLEKYVVTVCPREGLVYFERPETAGTSR